MHFDLKPISVESIPEAFEKVERYRLLNEPGLAESICLDILEIVPDHQQALISLLLARTEQFGSEMNASKARCCMPSTQPQPENRTARRPASTASGTSQRAPRSRRCPTDGRDSVTIEPC